MFPTFEFMGKTIGVYGLCSIAGLVVAGTVMYNLVKKKGIYAQDITLLAVAVAVGMFVGGHIVYGITHIPEIIDLFKNMPRYTAREFWRALGGCFGGMVFYGGLIGSFICIAVFKKFQIAANLQKTNIMDAYSVVVPLFHVFGRIGCFLGGCCYGIESSFGFIVTGNQLSPGVNDVRRFPVQLVEAGCNLIIFLVLLVLYKKGRAKDKLIYIYLLIYPAVRFGLEFLRGDEIRGFLFGLSTSQWISIGLFAFSVISLVIKSRQGQKSADGAEDMQ
ncbi:MAG: prolipoprotein diacylglyceryl transferase [Butyrivibrio sp.]|nr:prolipoprotein diacylglyceryl transferase [Butyrivibrio sp.]